MTSPSNATHTPSSVPPSTVAPNPRNAGGAPAAPQSTAPAYTNRGSADTAMTPERTVSALNTLLETCLDSSQGFTSAAESVKDASLRQTLTTLAEQRRGFAGEISREVTALKGTPATSGHVTGAIHRGWMGLKTAIASHNEHAILEECERGEDYAQTAFADALAEGLPEKIRAIISPQSQAVTKAHAQVRTLRDQFSGEPVGVGVDDKTRGATANQPATDGTVSKR